MGGSLAAIDREATLAALGREIQGRLSTAVDLSAAAGEPIDRGALHRAIAELVRYVAYTRDDPPRPGAGLDVLRAAPEREGVFGIRRRKRPR
ncbi:hypothetical protein [Halofilum ochraceum]|uniref:hypothetical protein n=1 Tax=Halofilum ochraceum TaxID=1611323 RepID=UPI0008DB3023|nr:hypothetical protein [Halofilum ochraceum]